MLSNFSPQFVKIRIASVRLFRLIVGTFFRQQMHVIVTGNNAGSRELVYETGHLLAGSAALLTMPRIVRAQTT
jgi:hypothetical protein